MRSTPPTVSRFPLRTSLRRFAFLGASFAAVLLSCGRDITAPTQSGARLSSALRFNTVFPQMSTSGAFATAAAFDKVHIVLYHTDHTIALDTTIAFPADSSQVSVSLSVHLLPSAPSSGEPMTLDLGYLNPQGQTVYSGTTSLTAMPDVAGVSAPAPVTVNVTYTGPGAGAKSVKISPRQLSVNTGSPFAYTAVALDANGNVVPNTPIEWVSLDPTRANISQSTTGVGNALNQRGTARIVATPITGTADTVVLSILPVATSIAAVSGSGQSGTVGAPTAVTLPQPLVVKVTAADGLGVAGTSVTFGAGSGSGSVSPTSTTTDVNGLAQATWTLGSTVGTQTASATSASLSGSPVAFTATGIAQVATKLVITAGPAAASNIGANTALSLSVAAQDASGAAVSNYAGTVSVTLSGGTSGAQLAGTGTVTAAGGVASFSNLSIGTPGTGYVLSVAAPGLTGASSSAFNIVPGAPATMILISGGGQSGAAGVALASPITVLVADAAGNASSGATVNFSASSGGTVSPTSAVTSATGKVSTTWTLGGSAGAQTLSVTSTNLPALTVNATATSTTNHWVISQQPGAAQVAGVAVTPAVVAQLFSPTNVLVTSFTGTTTLAIGANPGSATLAGTANVAAVAGVATFSNVSLDKVGTGYTLTVNSSGANAASSTAFNVSAGAATVLSLQSGNNQGGQASAPLAQPVVAKVTDAFGNPVAGTTVNFAVSAGGGSVGTATTTTTSSGLASTTWTLGATGAQTLSIASTGLTGSPLTASASLGAGPLVSSVVTPHFDTLTAFTDSYQLAASGRDAATNVVSGTWTWISRAPAIVTVNASGLVTAVANGSTYVVATETGGSKDSALVVVQQRIATINVTPGTRSLYTGGQFTFSASAVDGRGFAMAVQPTFVWSSTQPSVATVGATGRVQALSLGTSQIRATSGSTIGVSSLTVITPITRIDVSYDSTGAPVPDVFTMTSLGQQRVYRAVARDTLLNVMSGVTFVWSSANPTVAPIDSSNVLRAFATSNANGITSIQATAQGVTGAASLTVAQVLASIDLQPTSTTIAISGSTSMLARGRDARGRFIPGGTFTYASSAPSIATVNAATGVVTGVANGTTNITASAGAITSNVAVVAVNGSGPAIISFGRDTLAIGRSSSTSVPILLSKPNASPVTVNLTVGDTSAFWSSASVTIPANQTSVNATLNGHNAGTTFILAVDGSGTGYAPDTAVLLVQASVRMASNYSLNATDQLATQVLLSDPAPAGGTFVVFNYSTPGKASVSPNPAFIPAGQLASNVVITGLAAGSTTVTPSATGVNGTSASINVSAAVLSVSPSFTRLAAGQFYQNAYVQVPNTLNSPLTVTLTSSDTTIVTAPPTVQITNGSYVYFDVRAVGKGAAFVTLSAPGWTSATINLVSTTPRVTICCTSTFTTTTPVSNITVYAADSLRSIHNRINSLAVRLSSTDTSVMKVIDTVVTITAGNYYNTGRIIPGGNGGTAYLKVSASGHAPDDSVLVTVSGPQLSFSYTSSRIGAGQTDQNFYVTIPNPIAAPLTVTLNNSDPTKATAPATIVIPQGQNYAYFDIQGVAPGVSTFIATASGYTPDTATTVVTTPRIGLAGAGSLNNYQASTTNVYVRDSVGSAHNRTTPLTVRIASSDTTILTIDTLVTIPTGYYYVPQGVNITALSPGSVFIVTTAPGHRPDTVTWTVQASRLRLNYRTYIIGARQHRLPTDFYVQLPNQRSVAVPVTLTQKRASVLALSATALSVPANQGLQYFSFGGLIPGRDTIIASAPGYLPDTAFVTVTSPRLRAGGLPGTATTTNPPYTVTVYAADTTNNVHYASDTITVHAVSSDSTVIRPDSAYFHIIKNAYYANPLIYYTGPGTASMTYSDSANSGYASATTNTVTVTGPSLAISGGNPGMLGMRQQTSPSTYYVYAPNNVGGSGLVVNLVSTGPRVATVPASVTIPANSYYAYFTITAQDTIGTIQIQASATGYAGATSNMQVTAPSFRVNTSSQLNTTSPSQFITVYPQDAQGNIHYTTDTLVITLASSAPGVATIDSQTVTILPGNYYNSNARWAPGAAGTAQLSATDQRAAYYKYATGTANVSVVVPTPSLNYNNYSLGLGQYFDQYVYLPNNTTSAMTVPVTHAAVPRTSTPSSFTIAANAYYNLFRITGTSVGFDTVKVSPPGHNPANTFMTIGLGRVDPVSGWPSTVKAGDSTQVTMYARDPNGSAQYVAAATTFTLTPNANMQFVSGGANSAVITSVVIAQDTQYVQFWVKGVSAGTGSATITNSNYTTYSGTVTVTP